MCRSPMTLTTLATFISGVLAIATTTSGQLVHEYRILRADDGAWQDEFGSSIAISNGIVAVGAAFHADNGSSSGSAYLFDASTGVQLFKLLPNDGASGDWFGAEIAISDGIVAVGAKYDEDNGPYSGSAYLFDASTGEQIAKLLPNDGAMSDRFGESIAISDGVVAVGANGDDDNGSQSGSVYLFDASTGAQLAKLLPADGAANDWFGISVAMADGIIAIGAAQDGDNGSASGSAYLFDASTGEQLFKLLPSDGNAGSVFGCSIAIDSGVVAVGAFGDDDNGHWSGSAYLFDASTGAQLFKLLPSDGARDDKFGGSIAIGNGIVAVGASSDHDNGNGSGSAYLFDASTGEQIAKLLPRHGTTYDRFGNSIAIENGVVGVGASEAGRNETGLVYLIDPSDAIHLAVTTSCPGAGPIHINWIHATPDGRVVLLFARSAGRFRIPDSQACRGTMLGLSTHQLQIAYIGPSDAEGSGTLQTNASVAVCGGHLQLLDRTTCNISNVAVAE